MRTDKLLALGLVGLLLTAQSCIRLSTGNQSASPTILRSDDQGATWSGKDFVGTVRTGKKTRTVSIAGAAAGTLQFSRVNPALLILSTPASGIFISTSRGDQWTKTAYSGEARSLALDPLNDQIIYATGGITISKTEDQGKTWQTLFTLTKPGESISSIAVDSYNPNRVIASTAAGLLYQSLDAGKTWSILATVADSVFALRFYPPDTRTLFLNGAKEGLWKSSDGGTTWKSINATLADFPSANRSIHLTFAGTTGAVLVTASEYGLLRSTDVGEHWQTIRTLLPPPAAIIAAVINPTDEQKISLIAGNKLHRTSDGGATWAVSSLPTSRPVSFLRQDPTDPNVLYVGSALPLKKRSP